MTAISRENLKQAFLIDITEEFSNIPDDLPFEPSEAFKRKMENLIKRSRKPYYKYTATGLRRAVCVIAAILILMLSSLSVGAVRDAIKEFFITHFSDHAIIEHKNHIENQIVDSENKINNEYELGYIPKGFELAESISENGFVNKVYIKEEYYIMFTQTPAEEYSPNVDNEQSTMDYETYDGREYLVHQTGIDYTFIWDNERYVFDVSANIDKNEIIKMVKSLKICKN